MWVQSGMNMFSRRTDTVCDFPDPCTPHTTAEKGAFYAGCFSSIFHLSKRLRTVLIYNRGSNGDSLLVFELKEYIIISVPLDDAYL